MYVGEDTPCPMLFSTSTITNHRMLIPLGSLQATDDQACAAVIASCAPGLGYSASSTNVADAVCVVCTSGTVSAAEDNNECAAHAVTDCAAGRELTPGNAHKDGACAVCAAGKFNAETSTDPCAAHTVTSCSAGSEEIDGTSTVDSHCVSCTSGKFSTGGGSVRLSTHGSFKLF